MMNGLMPSAQDGRGKILIFTFFWMECTFR